MNDIDAYAAASIIVELAQLTNTSKSAILEALIPVCWDEEDAGKIAEALL